jgi:hypothetical protein
MEVTNRSKIKTTTPPLNEVINPIRKTTNDITAVISKPHTHAKVSRKSSNMSNITVASPIRKSSCMKNRLEAVCTPFQPVTIEKDPLIIQLEELQQQLRDKEKFNGSLISKLQI